MFTTKHRKVTIEILGQPVKQTGQLSSIEENEEMSEEGLITQNIVRRDFLTCGHRGADKSQGLTSCIVCRGIFCQECAKEGSLCHGCGRWLCPKHTRVSALTGFVLCPECGIYDAIKKKLKEGGILKWLDWSS